MSFVMFLHNLFFHLNDYKTKKPDEYIKYSSGFSKLVAMQGIEPHRGNNPSSLTVRKKLFT